MKDFLVVVMIGNKMLNFATSTEAMTMEFVESLKKELSEQLSEDLTPADITVLNIIPMDKKQSSLITGI
ncbi:hypothetical protein [Enterococcus phage vB_OCPT_SDS2]|uniref:Uncharacterized protein n=1 Tax=Enterococcus phage PMBT56 TaxID=3229530 RepID=A0AB39C6C9_9CAUD|nr:hypothetical protein [Enterococcus phage vB_EfaS_Ef2.2]UKM17635.1 hypothetical protein [Enterococcus phage UTI-EfS7]UQT00873.1 hypothetical protein [Enterococcus phage vB_OCPT_SDS2]UQT01148.1 hypothetical protein QOFMPA_00025 [Enterococcus phage vB_OCPT_Toy]